MRTLILAALLTAIFGSVQAKPNRKCQTVAINSKGKVTPSICQKCLYVKNGKFHWRCGHRKIVVTYSSMDRVKP